MKFLLPLAFLTLTTAVPVYAQGKSVTFNAEAWEAGPPPEEVFVVDGQFSVVAQEGNKALQVDTTGELLEACALLGDSANGGAAIETRVFATKQGRSLPRFALGVHGQSGYRLVAFPAKKELQLVKGDEIIKTMPLDWTSGTWWKMKLAVKKKGEKEWSIDAKAWPADGKEPETQLSHTDATLKGQGKCSIWGTPYSNTPILFDDIVVTLD